ncbi:branched-chain amino acid ABC transporter permease [Bordetella petrii]|nr:branched-chain amino acid ABC transporter permease [Bordetella petrii]
METIVQLVLIGVQISSVYVLFALGLTLIFGVLRIVNFAHGQFFTISALIVSVAIPWLISHGFSITLAYVLGCIIGIACATLLGAISYQLAFRRFQRDMTGSFVLSVGLVLLFEGINQNLFGGGVRTVPPLLGGNVSFLGMSLSSQRLLLCALAVVLAVALVWMLSTTRLGKAMRAVSIDYESAMLQGIAYRSIAFRGFVIATAIGAVAGALIAPISTVTPVFGDSYLIKGFIAVIIGGLGSVPGAILGSLFIAFLETFVGFYLDPSSASLAIFVLVMLVLLIKPQGVLGRA